LVLSSRGITHRFRHLMLDVLKLLPHSTKDSKLEGKDRPMVINEIAEVCPHFLHVFLYTPQFVSGDALSMLGMGKVIAFHNQFFLPLHMFLPNAQPTPQMRGCNGALYFEARKREDKNQQQ
jgi:hypothetical protein